MFWYARKNSALWCRDQQRNTANVGMGLNSSTPKHVHYYWSGISRPGVENKGAATISRQPSHSHYLAEVTWQVVAVKPNKVSPRLNVQLQVHVLSPRTAPPRPAPAPTQGDLGSLEPLEPGHWWLVAICRSSLPVLAPHKVVLSTSPLTRLCRVQL